MALQFKREFKNTNVNLENQNSPRSPIINQIPVITSFLADSSGCSYIRLMEPLMHLSYHGKGIVNTSHMMIFSKETFTNSNAVIIQRQGEQHQLEYFKNLKNLQQSILAEKGTAFKLIFEVDDLFLLSVKGLDGKYHHGIPDYNAAKENFKDPNHDSRVKEIINLCDEFIVCSSFMKETYRNTLGYNKITTFPNLISKRWAGNHYNEENVLRNFEKNKKKPRVCWNGSPTHFKITGKVEKQEDLYDDFIHVGKSIIETLDKYQWVLFGGCPVYLKKYVDSGQIEFHEWVNIMDFPEKLKSLNVQCTIAPLIANYFSHSKSWQKLLDSWVQGLPCVAQECPPYADARYKFQSGEEMISKIDEVLNGNYSEISKQSRQRAEGLFIQDHMDDYLKLFLTPYGDKSRKESKLIYNLNKEQFPD
jgi:hypothetical protein